MCPRLRVFNVTVFGASLLSFIRWQFMLRMVLIVVVDGKLFLREFSCWHHNRLLVGVFQIDFHDRDTILIWLQEAFRHNSCSYLIVSDTQILHTILAGAGPNQFTVQVLLLFQGDLARCFKGVLVYTTHWKRQARSVHIDKVATFLWSLR